MKKILGRPNLQNFLEAGFWCWENQMVRSCSFQSFGKGMDLKQRTFLGPPETEVSNLQISPSGILWGKSGGRDEVILTPGSRTIWKG